MNDQIRPMPFMKRDIAIILLSIAFLGIVPAAYPQAGRPGGTDDALKSAVAVKRDPFWPVGYKPQWVIEKNPEGQEVVLNKSEGTIDWDKAMKQVEIQGVSSRADNESFAVINGQVKCAGETVSLRVDSVNYTWMVENISPPNSVKLRRVSAR